MTFGRLVQDIGTRRDGLSTKRFPRPARHHLAPDSRRHIVLELDPIQYLDATLLRPHGDSTAHRTFSYSPGPLAAGNPALQSPPTGHEEFVFVGQSNFLDRLRTPHHDRFGPVVEEHSHLGSAARQRGPAAEQAERQPAQPPQAPRTPGAGLASSHGRQRVTRPPSALSTTIRQVFPRTIGESPRDLRGWPPLCPCAPRGVRCSLGQNVRDRTSRGRSDDAGRAPR